MFSTDAYLVELANLAVLEDPAARRATFRQGMAMLAAATESSPAPLEGLATEALQQSVRVAVNDGLFDDLDWLTAANSAVALYELAQALPPSAERRELGRRVLSRLRNANAETFVRLAISIARTAPKLLLGEANSMRAQQVFLTSSFGCGALALSVLAQPALTLEWIHEASRATLVERQCAARILAHAAREAVRAQRNGDTGGVRLFGEPQVRSTLALLLTDRESLVWRWAAIARGIAAHIDPDCADDIAHGFRKTDDNGEMRRSTVSAVAAFEFGGAAIGWWETVVANAKNQAGIARSAIMGLAGFAAAAPEQADEFGLALLRAGAAYEFDVCEAVGEFCREESPRILPRTTADAVNRIRTVLAEATIEGDFARKALAAAILVDLTAESPAEQQGVLPSNARARRELALGEVARAQHSAIAAIDELAIAIDTLAKPSFDDLGVELELRILRELDREILADTTLSAILASGADNIESKAVLRGSLHQLEAVLVMREVDSIGAQFDLRLAQLRALIHLLDSAPHDDDATNRIVAIRHLLAKAKADNSNLRRPLYVALTRAVDIQLRSGEIDVSDILLAWPAEFSPDEDFTIVRQASMLPNLENALLAYVALVEATRAAADPSKRDAQLGLCDALANVAQTLPPSTTPRVEGVRIAVRRLAGCLRRVASAGSQRDLQPEVFDQLAEAVHTLAARIIGARRKLDAEPIATLGSAAHSIRAIGHVLRQLQGATSQQELNPSASGSGAWRDVATELVRDFEEKIALAAEQATAALPYGFAKAIELPLFYYAQLPTAGEAGDQPLTEEQFSSQLPVWLPLSRRLGGFEVVRGIGRGAGGSVLLALRVEDAKRRASLANAVALKVPDYDGSAARTMSEQEFEAVFREEASALLSLPAHKNLAGFITFDASAKPKPILVMEYVRGPNLENVIDGGRLSSARAVALIDGILQGLAVMHAHGLAHLDVKPPNVVLRSGSDEAVLVDFGLAGRRLRVGCGSPHYAAAEIWRESGDDIPPFAADVYATACIAAELLSGETLIKGESLADVVGRHMIGHGANRIVAPLRSLGLSELSSMFAAALSRDWRERPTAAAFAACLAAHRSIVAKTRWPVVALPQDRP